MAGVPDSYTLTEEFAVGATLLLTIPAQPNVSHIITAITCNWLAQAGAAASGPYFFNYYLGAVGCYLGFIGNTVAGPDLVTFQWQGEILVPPNGSVGIGNNGLAVPNGVISILIIEGTAV